MAFIGVFLVCFVISCIVFLSCLMAAFLLEYVDNKYPNIQKNLFTWSFVYSGIISLSVLLSSSLTMLFINYII